MDLLTPRTSDLLEAVHDHMDAALFGPLEKPLPALVCELRERRDQLSMSDREAITRAIRKAERAWGTVNKCRQDIRRLICDRAPEVDGIKRGAVSERLPMITTAPGARRPRGVGRQQNGREQGAPGRKIEPIPTRSPLNGRVLPDSDRRTWKQVPADRWT